jgi:hypothetical protein
VKSYFSGRNWRSINVESMKENYAGDPSACLSFMTPEAFRYFFPSYIRMAYMEYDVADAIFDVVIAKLHSVAFGDSYLIEIIEGYGPRQLEAIATLVCKFSEKFCKYYPKDLAAEAFAKYWHKHSRL